MPRYYFHVHYGDAIATDDDGIERADLEQARAEALSGIRSMLAEEVLSGELSFRGKVVVMDDANCIVATVPFRDAVTVRPD